MKRLVVIICLVGLFVGGCVSTPTTEQLAKREREQEKLERIRIQEQKEPMKWTKEWIEQKEYQIDQDLEQERLRRQKRDQLRARAGFKTIEEEVQEMLQNGTIHSITPELNEIRVDPLIWSLLTVEIKKALMQNFGQYFSLHPKAVGGVVTVRSKYSDEKLGSTSFFGGYKIHK